MNVLALENNNNNNNKGLKKNNTFSWTYDEMYWLEYFEDCSMRDIDPSACNSTW